MVSMKVRIRCLCTRGKGVYGDQVKAIEVGISCV